MKRKLPNFHVTSHIHNRNTYNADDIIQNYTQYTWYPNACGELSTMTVLERSLPRMPNSLMKFPPTQMQCSLKRRCRINLRVGSSRFNSLSAYTLVEAVKRITYLWQGRKKKSLLDQQHGSKLTDELTSNNSDTLSKNCLKYGLNRTLTWMKTSYLWD